MEETSKNYALTLDSSIVVEDNATRTPVHGFSCQTLLLFAAGLVIRVLCFQISLLISPFTYIIWLFHCSLFLILNPFGTLRHVRDGVMEKFLWISNSLLERISSKLYEKLKSQHKLVKRMSRGIFWSFYVFLVLLALLVMAFVAGSSIMHRVVEEPVMIEKDFSFDYTKSSPDALVKFRKWDTVPFGLDAGGKLFVPPNHMVKLKVSLTLPESDYNWKLGIFQVKAELLSREGQLIISVSHPCMLRFKSSVIRYLETIIRSGYLLTGYSLESQTLCLEMTGFTEGAEPTASVRIILEQRSEYMAGAGIPQIYSASMRLESELPFFRRVIWHWRWTLLTWVSMGFFMFELLIILVCYWPLLVLRASSKKIFYKEVCFHENLASCLKA